MIIENIIGNRMLSTRSFILSMCNRKIQVRRSKIVHLNSRIWRINKKRNRMKRIMINNCKLWIVGSEVETTFLEHLVYTCTGLGTISFPNLQNQVQAEIQEKQLEKNIELTQRSLNQYKYKIYSVQDQNIYSLSVFVNNQQIHILQL